MYPFLEFKNYPSELEARTKILTLPAPKPILLLERAKVIGTSYGMSTSESSYVSYVILKTLDDLNKENVEVKTRLDQLDEVTRAQAHTINWFEEVLSSTLARL